MTAKKKQSARGRSQATINAARDELLGSVLGVLHADGSRGVGKYGQELSAWSRCNVTQLRELLLARAKREAAEYVARTLVFLRDGGHNKHGGKLKPVHNPHDKAQLLLGLIIGRSIDKYKVPADVHSIEAACNAADADALYKLWAELHKLEASSQLLTRALSHLNDWNIEEDAIAHAPGLAPEM